MTRLQSVRCSHSATVSSFVTDKCTYRLRVADQIDPERKNPALPHNTQQKLFDHGVQSQQLCNTLLLGRMMFRKEFLKIDVERAKQLAMDALSELVAMHDASREFRTAEEAAMEKPRQSTPQERALTIPSLGNVQTHCKTFIQRADHFAGALLRIARLFYPDERQMNWADLQELVKARYGESDTFYKILEQAVPNLQLIRDARDCLEHHNPGVTTKDFELEPDGMIAPPAIAMAFRETKLERCSIRLFMEEIEPALLTYFEMIVVHLCSRNVQPFAGMPIIVGALSQQQQAAWRVRFAWGMYYQMANSHRSVSSTECATDSNLWRLQEFWRLRA
jgi:hypothetical protein